MRRIVKAMLVVLVLGGCETRASAPNPTFDPVFPPIEGNLMTISSPALRDLTGDGVPDIVFGTGVDRVKPENGKYVFASEPEISGHVVAVSGATNEVLWDVPNPRDAFTTPRFQDVNGDGVPDVIMGGREGSFGAFSGTDGAVVWRVLPGDIAATPAPYNFFSPAFIRDVNGDGVPELVVVYGGNATKRPGEPRDPGFLVVVSGADGDVLAVQPSPDGKEMYTSVVVYERGAGDQWLVFGSGGETDSGAAYRAPVASLLDGTFSTRTERLVEPGTKGVIAPATLVDLTADGEPDIIISSFDGRLIAVNGASGAVIWERKAEGEETYHQPAVVRLSADGRLGLFVSRGIGVFPRYVASVHRLYDASDGRVLYEYRDPFYPAGAPLAVDLTGDGIDEPIFFSVRFPSAQGARIHILDIAADTLITHDLPANFWSTPVVADVRGTGTLELIGLSWWQQEGAGTPNWRDLHWRLMRLDLGAPAPAFRSWAGYMGTSADGKYTPPANTDRPSR